jgi:hypothetical protein
LAAAALACGNARPPSPYTSAEVEQALAPVRQIQARCYEVSESKRQGHRVEMQVALEIDRDGRVQAIPGWVKPREAALVECVRSGLNELRFPAKGHDHLELDLELGPS